MSRDLRYPPSVAWTIQVLGIRIQLPLPASRAQRILTAPQRREIRKGELHMGTANIQGPLWGAKAEDWALVQEPYWRPLYDEVLRQARAGRRKRLLDVGCGGGEALLAAIELGAEPVGLDASEALVAVARRRLPGTQIEVGEIESLPFPDDQFDLVTSFNAFQFAGDLLGALTESSRVCRPGGAVVMFVWGPPGDCDITSRVIPKVMALLPPAPAGGATAPAFHLEGVMETWMRKVGLTPITTKEIDCVFVYPDLEIARRAISAAAPITRAERHAGTTAVQDALYDALVPFLDGDGSVRLRNRFRYVIAEQPT
jgi:SAM-dependent methyltransferase